MTRNNTKGFTLIEVMLAMVILSTTLILLANSWSGAFGRVRKTQQNFEVAALLERKMGEIELKYRGKSLDEIPESEEESFGEEFPQYSWKLETQKLEFPDLSSLVAGGEDNPNEQNPFLSAIVKQLGEAISKSVKEARVTVIFKAPNVAKPIEYSATMYFVDYDQEVPLSMPAGG